MMLLLSDRLMAVQDEGLVKLVSRLAGLLRQQRALIIGYGPADAPDLDFRLPRLCSFASLRLLARRPERDILFAPWRRNCAALLFLMAMTICGKRVRLLVANQHGSCGGQLSPAAWLIYHILRPELILPSKDSADYFSGWYRGKITPLCAAVDTTLFHPVSPGQKAALREKYGLPQGVPLYLHAGHITLGRRLDWMLEIPEPAFGVLVASRFWTPEEPINARLRNRKNVLILDDYYPSVHEIFQACDLLVFTPQSTSAMDVPLSVFEAMACNLYVISTRHGELCRVEEGDGLVYVSGDDPCEIVSQAADLLARRPVCRTREKALPYDWTAAVNRLLS